MPPRPAPRSKGSRYARPKYLRTDKLPARCMPPARCDGGGAAAGPARILRRPGAPATRQPPRPLLRAALPVAGPARASDSETAPAQPRASLRASSPSAHGIATARFPGAVPHPAPARANWAIYAIYRHGRCQAAGGTPNASALYSTCARLSAARSRDTPTRAATQRPLVIRRHLPWQRGRSSAHLRAAGHALRLCRKRSVGRPPPAARARASQSRLSAARARNRVLSLRARVPRQPPPGAGTERGLRARGFWQRRARPGPRLAAYNARAPPSDSGSRGIWPFGGGRLRSVPLAASPRYMTTGAEKEGAASRRAQLRSSAATAEGASRHTARRARRKATRSRERRLPRCGGRRGAKGADTQNDPVARFPLKRREARRR